MSKREVEGPRLRLNPIRCEAHGLCLQALPEMLKTDPWGYPLVNEAGIPPALLAHARRAVALCPTLALELVPRGEGGRS